MDDWGQIEEEPTSPIVESFDDTWGHNFRWAFDAQTGQVTAWKTDKPEHQDASFRIQVEEMWGRAPKVNQGDKLGVASYTPTERNVDGSVTAPPEVKIHTFYDAQCPQEVKDKFEEMFPGVVTRNARVAAVRYSLEMNPIDEDWKPDDEQEPVSKWVWNQHEGILVWQTDENMDPSHPDKIWNEWHRPWGSKDVLGVGVETPDSVEIQTYGAATAPTHVLQQVKAEYAKLYPDKQIVLPNDAAEALGVEFSNDPKLLLRDHSASAAFMAAQIPLEAPVSSFKPDFYVDGVPVTSELLFPELEPLRASWGWLTWLNRKQGGTGADKEGAMVAVFLPEDTGNKIKIKGGEPTKDMHVTLAYFVDKQADRDDWDEVEKIVASLAKKHPKLQGKINGFGVFQNEVDVLWAAPSVPGLAELRQEIVEACEDAGFSISDDYGWTPHITLKYDHKGKLPKLDGAIEFEFGQLSFAKGDDHEHFDLTGHIIKETTIPTTIPVAGLWGGPTYTPRLSAAYQPTWEGAHRFTTDGKRVSVSPEENFLDKQGNDTLGELQHRDQFRQLYPDHEGAASGWVLPTADGEGYGIYSPGSGWGGDYEPQIHEIIHSLDRYLGKPTHWINEWPDAANPDYYTHGEKVEEDAGVRSL